jgi:hypothetical protein
VLRLVEGRNQVGDDNNSKSEFDVDPEELRKQFWGDEKPKNSTGPGNGVDNTPAGAVPVREFPILAEEAFYGLAGKIVRTIAPHTESDPALLLISAHVYFGNAIGRGPYHIVEGTAHYPNLNALFVGDTAKARKGTGDGRIRQVFSVAAPGWYAFRIKNGLSSGEGLIAEVRDPVIKLVKGEEKVVDEGADDKRLLVVQSEFGGALQAMRREGSMLSAVMRDAWDGRNLATLVRHSPLRATDAHISVIGHITKRELVYLFDQVSMANGLGNRFLFGCVRRSNILPFGGNLPRDVVTELGLEVGAAIECAQQIGEVVWSSGTPEEPGGAEGWEQIYATLSEAKPGLVGALSARAEAQVIRLDLNYALWDASPEIRPPHLMAALAIRDYCEASVHYVFGDKVGNPITDTILAALKNAYPQGLTRTEIRDLFSHNVSIATSSEDLQTLGLAVMSRRPANGRGRPAEIWTWQS